MMVCMNQVFVGYGLIEAQKSSDCLHYRSVKLPILMSYERVRGNSYVPVINVVAFK